MQLDLNALNASETSPSMYSLVVQWDCDGWNNSSNRLMAVSARDIPQHVEMYVARPARQKNWSEVICFDDILFGPKVVSILVQSHTQLLKILRPTTDSQLTKKDKFIFLQRACAYHGDSTEIKKSLYSTHQHHKIIHPQQASKGKDKQKTNNQTMKEINKQR